MNFGLRNVGWFDWVGFDELSVCFCLVCWLVLFVVICIFAGRVFWWGGKSALCCVLLI